MPLLQPSSSNDALMVAVKHSLNMIDTEIIYSKEVDSWIFYKFPARNAPLRLVDPKSLKGEIKHQCLHNDYVGCFDLRFSTKLWVFSSVFWNDFNSYVGISNAKVNFGVSHKRWVEKSRSPQFFDFESYVVALNRGIRIGCRIRFL